MNNYYGNSNDIYDARGQHIEYEEPDPPQPWERFRCGHGHFMSQPLTTRDWVEDGTGEHGEPLYRPAREGERPYAVEVWCPTCKGWFQP